MISNIDIEDMKPEGFEEEQINDDKAYWISMELTPFKIDMGYGRFKLGQEGLQEEQ